MSSLAISWLVFGCIFGGALLGMLIRAVLPKHHLSPDSKDVVKLGMGLIATMSALVLGLLVASAKSSFDAQRSELTQISANAIYFDRTLARYGPETKEARAMLRAAVRQRARTDLARRQVAAQPGGRNRRLRSNLRQALGACSQDRRAAQLQAQALKLATDVAQMRWLLFAQKGSSIPTPFLVVLVFWLMIIFASFTLFAPVNATVIVTLLVCALSVAGAIFLILELDRPFAGLIQISSAPLRNALEQLGR